MGWANNESTSAYENDYGPTGWRAYGTPVQVLEQYAGGASDSKMEKIFICPGAINQTAFQNVLYADGHVSGYNYPCKMLNTTFSGRVIKGDWGITHISAGTMSGNMYFYWPRTR